MVALNHLYERTAQIVHLSDHERFMFMTNPVWLGYPLANNILSRMENTMNYPIRPRVECLLVVGEPNCGKTSIANQFHKEHGATYVDDNNDPHFPVVLVEAPGKPSVDGIYLAILDALLVEDASRGSSKKLEDQVLHLMRIRHARILLIDEIHCLYACSKLLQQQMMNVLKSLCNKLSIPIVGFGTVDALNILHHDAQHASRFNVMKLESWKANTEFQTFLRRFEGTLPLRKPSNLASPSMAQAIYACTDGVTGAVKSLLVSCAQQAIQKKSEQITIDDINEIKTYLVTADDGTTRVLF